VIIPMNRIPLHILLVVLFVACVSPGTVSAQSESERAPMQVLQDALRRGDTSTLSTIAADRVEVILFGSAAMYSRGQAMYVLGDFFRQYPPDRVSFTEGSRAGANWFVIGEYSYEGGEQALRLFVRMRTKDGRPELRELRIDRRGGS
jgi:hypothetical protein